MTKGMQPFVWANTLDYLTLPPEGALSVQIPIDSTILVPLVNNYLNIIDECKAWCKTEIKNSYGFHRVKLKESFWPTFGYHLWFTDEKDAILFKMRWL